MRIQPIRLSWLIWVLGFFFIASVSGQVQQTYEGEIRLALKAHINEPLSIGSTMDISLAVAYDRLPKQARIYVHLMTLAGEKWVTTHEAECSGSDLNFQIAGGMTDSKSSLFGFSDRNYPISKLIEKDKLVVLLKSFAGDEQTAKKFADAVSDTDNGYDLVLAFLVATGDNTSGDADATLRITVPDYPTYYDGILIVPFVFAYDSKDQPFVYVSSKNMRPLRISVKPNRPRPVAKEIKQVLASDLRGEVVVSEYHPEVLVVGRANSVKVKINYKDLVPGTAVYLAAVPFDKGNYIFGQYALTLPSIKGTVVPTFSQDRSKTYGFAVENRPIEFSFVAGQTLEAGLVGTVVNGGSGVVEGTVSFSPPAYVNKYERVHLMPVLLVPTDSGNRVLIESDRLQGPKVLVAGGS
jgi:hypothetical protein